MVLVPITGLLWKQKAGWSRWLGALLALGGLYFLSITADFAISKGDLLVLLSAIFWTAHVQMLARFSPKVDPVQLSCVQFAVCAVLSLFTAALFEQPRWSMVKQAAIPILYGGLASVGIAYTLQAVAQKYAQPTHASIIMSLEGAFAVLGGMLILGETLTTRAILGCALMLGGMITSQASALRNKGAEKPGSEP